MKKYTIKIYCDIDDTTYTYVVEASSKESAYNKAKELFCRGCLSIMTEAEYNEVFGDDRSEMPWDYGKHFD